MTDVAPSTMNDQRKSPQRHNVTIAAKAPCLSRTKIVTKRIKTNGTPKGTDDLQGIRISNALGDRWISTGLSADAWTISGTPGNSSVSRVSVTGGGDGVGVSVPLRAESWTMAGAAGNGRDPRMSATGDDGIGVSVPDRETGSVAVELSALCRIQCNDVRANLAVSNR